MWGMWPHMPDSHSVGVAPAHACVEWLAAVEHSALQAVTSGNAAMPHLLAQSMHRCMTVLLT